MIYALIIWTVVSTSPGPVKEDWRKLTEIHQTASEAHTAAQRKCEKVAAELRLATDRYRCIRIK